MNREGKKVYLTSFIHPSNSNRTRAKPKVVKAQQETEIEELRFIRDWLAKNDDKHAEPDLSC